MAVAKREAEEESRAPICPRWLCKEELTRTKVVVMNEPNLTRVTDCRWAASWVEMTGTVKNRLGSIEASLQ
jgi:hypothetical protein